VRLAPKLVGFLACVLRNVANAPFDVARRVLRCAPDLLASFFDLVFGLLASFFDLVLDLVRLAVYVVLHAEVLLRIESNAVTRDGGRSTVSNVRSL